MSFLRFPPRCLIFKGRIREKNEVGMEIRRIFIRQNKIRLHNDTVKIESVKLSLSFFLENFFCLKPFPDQDRVNIQIGRSVPEEIGFKHT